MNEVADIRLISREPIGHGEVIERIINRAGVPYTSILKYGHEVASCPTAEEYRMIKWWNTEGFRLWTGKNRSLTINGGKDGTD